MTGAEQLGVKLSEWRERIEGRDRHSVNRQIAHMLWRSAFYRSINESRRFLLKDAENREMSNGTLHELIDEGYFTMASISIRRLLDRGSPSGPKGVVSLYGLIEDIRENVHLLTRSNVLGARQLLYDYEPVKQKAREEAWARQEAAPDRGTFVSRTGWADAEFWHRAMDKLCAVSAESRVPSDTPNPQRFVQLLQDLTISAEGVKDWADKFVAHTSTLQSRETLDVGHREMSLAKLWRAECVIVRAAAFVSMNIVDGLNNGGVPIPQFDQFEYLDQPFAAKGTRHAMEQAWREHSGKIRSCSEWFWDEPLIDHSDIWSDQSR